MPRPIMMSLQPVTSRHRRASTTIPALFGDVRQMGWTALDQNVWLFIDTTWEGTQRGLLEFLFGAGLMVTAAKAMEPDGPVAVADLYIRRNLWLLAFGGTGLRGLRLGTGLGFRQSLLALLSSFALAALILGSLAPVTFFLAWNAPLPTAPGAANAHATYLVAHTALIGFAGITANLHLHRLLAVKAPTAAAATATLLAWLGGNGFLGAQFSWILRPFFGTPRLKVQFLRPDPFDGNFYETVWKATDRISGGFALPVLCLILVFLLTPILHAIYRNHQTTPKP